MPLSSSSHSPRPDHKDNSMFVHSGCTNSGLRHTGGTFRKAFVYRRVPRVLSAVCDCSNFASPSIFAFYSLHVKLFFYPVGSENRVPGQARPIPFPKFGYFPQGVFDPPIGVLDFVRLLLLRTLQAVKFILVALFNVSSSPRPFGLEASPDILIIVLVLLLEQAEGFLSAKLDNAGEILHAESI